MLVNFTNHLGTDILNHLGNNIQFELSGAVDKNLVSNIATVFSGSTFLTREDYSNASVTFTELLSGSQTKELKMNDFGRDPAFVFTNHLGNQITNHLLSTISFVPNNGFKTTFDLTGNVQLHKLIDAVINSSVGLNAETIRYKILSSTVDYLISLTGSLLKEGNLLGQVSVINDLSAIINAYRNINSDLPYNFVLIGSQSKEININNFVQSPVIFTNHLGNHLTDHLSADISFLPMIGIKSSFDLSFTAQLYKPTNAGLNTVFIITGESKAYNNMAAVFDYAITLAGTQTKEIKINASDIKASFNFTSDAQLHRLIDSVMSNSISITADLFRQRLLNGEIDYAISISGTQLREGNLTGRILTMNELSAVLNAYRNINAECHYNAELEAFLMRRIKGWDTLIIKFKE
jgi:hypothetical protein